MNATRQALPERLSRQVANERIRFSMACNTLVIRSADHKVVQLVDGTHASVPVSPIRLVRGNDHDVSGRTRFFDREDPTVDEHGMTDKQITDAVFDWMLKHPGAINDVRVQLQVHGETDPVQPFPGYDQMDPTGIRTILDVAREYDLKGLIKYELEVRPTQIDPTTGEAYEPREEVVDLIDDINEERALTEIIDANEGVDGL